MKRLPIAARPDWQQLASRVGFRHHTYVDGPYWCDDGYFEFSAEEISRDIRPAMHECWNMCLAVVERAASDDQVLHSLRIPEIAWDALRRSWLERAPSLCTRFDLAFGDGSPPKLHECNGDTPGCIFEAAVFQWIWLEERLERGDLHPASDQFNRLHEALVEAFARLSISGPIHVAASARNIEDQVWARYLHDCACQTRRQSDFMDLESIGVDQLGFLTDLDDRAISCLVKAYRWERLLHEPFGPHLVRPRGPTVIEPLWKLVMSSKGLLVWLWRLFPGHPNLLPCWFEGDPAAAPGDGYVIKPLFSIKGGNVRLVDPILAGGGFSTPGPYGAEGHVIQALHRLPSFPRLGGRCYASVGAWMVDGKPEGIGILEADGPIIHDEESCFVPHVVVH